jgi:hypothetical protein
MADVLANGWGTVIGSRASPQTLLSSDSNERGANFVTLRNTSLTDWLFAKEVSDPGVYKVAGPGQALTIAMGPPSANNVKLVKGFATTTDGTTASDGVVVLVEAIKKA